ncbi:hypothetical protein AKJ40_02725 [candidate division MSBL1 archaeon SCGC-AAA259M10]|uniref:CRISPR system ring nuclease SSO1393-like domain-containing protein n=1 Tax=candidate division MSBL1 archaeon SCGC-AAA259M10 TaxID=1698270 RepID=A0A133UZK1_9EURY|nr:hypothetical protein AKJ40_02725 [candidate division MSBL1 archaeon SCGC-AAA259M10]
MEVYITLLGRSTWALLNTFYAVVNEGNKPDSVHIYVEKSYEDELEAVEKGLKIIANGFNFSPEIKPHMVNDASFAEAVAGIRKTLQGLIKGDNKVMIDITPGRKALVAGALLSAFDLSTREDLKVDRIFYLAIETTEDVEKPYFMIPMEIQELTEMREEMKK